jgi:hypothetical protein
VIQFALGLVEVEAVHRGNGRNETVHLLAPAFGHLAHDPGFDPEVYGLGEHVRPHLMAAARTTQGSRPRSSRFVPLRWLLSLARRRCAAAMPSMPDITSVAQNLPVGSPAAAARTVPLIPSPAAIAPRCGWADPAGPLVSAPGLPAGWGLYLVAGPRCSASRRAHKRPSLQHECRPAPSQPPAYPAPSIRPSRLRYRAARSRAQQPPARFSAR